MNTRAPALSLLAILAVVGCNEPERKSLVERLYEHRLKRCVAMLREERCEPPQNATYRDGLNHLHRVMVEEVARSLPQDGTCSTHGDIFLICRRTSKMFGTSSHVLYKIDDGKLIEWSDHLYDDPRPSQNAGRSGARR